MPYELPKREPKLPTKRFSREALAGFEATKYMHIRAGDHRYIRIWVVVVAGRVIVRSWNDKPSGWYRAFLSHPRGHVKINDRDLPIHAVALRGKRLNDAADAAYAAKYTTKADAIFVKGFATASRKATTLELIPG